LRSTVKVLKARHLKGVHIEVESSVKEKTRLEGIGMLRAWLHYVAEEREGREKAARLKAYRRNVEMHEMLTIKVRHKAGLGFADFLHQVCFDLWAKVVEGHKKQDEVQDLTTKGFYYKSRHQNDVRKLMFMSFEDRAILRKCAFFAAWVTLLKGEQHTKNLVAYRAGVRRKNFERVSSTVAKWSVDADDVFLGLVLRAFGQNVADARAATGQNKVLHVQRAWRSNALKSGQCVAEAVEDKSNLKALLGWKVQSTQDRRDSLQAQCGDWSNKYQEATMQSKLVSSHCEALRQNLAVQLLSAEQRSEEAMDQSDKLRGCTGELWTEMHRQNLALDSLEHEVLLLEAQNNGSHLHRWKQANESGDGGGVISPIGLLNGSNDSA